jgi:phenylalanyl-tRNA synthetase beta chain
MIASHSWLRAFAPHNKSATEIGDLFSRHVVTLDALRALRSDLAPIVVGQVVEAGRHPNSDHLWVTKVDDGSGTLLDVVCGAPNVTVGTKYPFARSGTTMPDGLKIEKRKIRGETSNGMLCSARELKLSGEHDGILALTTDAATGTPILDVLAEVGDVQLDLDVLPNRPDLLSHIGLAREIGAVLGVAAGMPAELPNPSPVERTSGAREASADGVTIRLDDTDSCPRYIAVVIRDVRVAPSPDWLRERLESVGARSINNIVDITNYALLGLGQPMHAFDLKNLRGSAIVVRPVSEVSTFTTLDGTSRPVAAGTTMICDGTGPTAFAGVMGGRESEVTAETRDVLLEVACFDPKFVRRVRRAIGVSTDASYRYERGTDHAALEHYARVMAALIRVIAGGRVTALLDVGTAPAARTSVLVRPTRVARLLGDVVPREEIVRILTALGCTVAEAPEGAMNVTPPSWRHDLTIEADFIEEVARIRGFDALPDELRAFRPTSISNDPLHDASLRVRNHLVGAGLAEARPMPFTADASSGTRVLNPLAEDEPYLRARVLDSLAKRAEYNLARMQGNVRLFEIGHVFLPSSGRLPREEMHVGALIIGSRRPVHFTEKSPPMFDAWDARGLAESVAASAFPGSAIATVPRSDGAFWDITVDGSVRGSVERVQLDAPVWAADAFGIELSIGVLQSDDVAAAGQHAHGHGPHVPRPAPVLYSPLPTMPAAEFDISLLIPTGVQVGQVSALLARESGELLESLTVFDEYVGAGLPEGVRSVSFGLRFRHPDRTLRDKELDGRRAKLLAALTRELGVSLRV